MSALRHRFRIVVDEQQYEIQTTARDMANAESDDEHAGGVWTTFRLVHAAALRLDLPVPVSLDEFVDVLDEVTALDADMADVEPDPTHAAV